jgi:hypothetical protein
MGLGQAKVAGGGHAGIELADQADSRIGEAGDHG